MTQILTCLTPSAIVQIADRRLTWLSGPDRGKVADDNRNKMIVVCNRLTIAYSGLAHVQSQPTDEWVVEAVSNPHSYSVTSVLRALRASANAAFSSMNVRPEKKRHAFVVAGWATEHRGGPLRPFAWSVANALDDAWKWVDLAGSEFVTRHWTLPGDQDVFLIETGVPLPATVQRSTFRQLQNCYHRQTSGDAYVRILAEAIWLTPDSSVGNNLLAVVLPLEATQNPPGLTGATSFPLPRDRVASFSITPDVPSAEFYAPNYTCGPVTYRSVSYGFGEPDYGPERPPWYDGVILLSPRTSTEADPSIRPVVVDRYRVAGFSLVGEYRREEADKKRPTPAIVRIGDDSPDLPVISSDPDCFILCRDAADAGSALTSEWKAGVAESLDRLGLSSNEVKTAQESLDRMNTRGEAVYWLREFFRR